MNVRQAFRRLMAKEGCILLPGAYDCLSAAIIDKLGFEAIDVTGLGIEASRLGQPDLGLASMSEVIDQCWNIVRSVDIPVICDADTGYGGTVNVARSVKAFETIGAAGIHMEDQAMPKKCGNLSGKVLIPLEEMTAKIRVAREVLDDKSFTVIARCDARAMGLDEVRRRLHAYLEAGADMVMLGDDYPLDELPKAVEEFKGRMYYVSAVYPGPEMCCSLEEYAAMGIKAVSYPVVSLLAAAKAIEDVYASLKVSRHFSVEDHRERCMPLKTLNELTKIDTWFGYEKK